eukprot:2849881-Rhodomonas_salina.1
MVLATSSWNIDATCTPRPALSTRLLRSATVLDRHIRSQYQATAYCYCMPLYRRDDGSMTAGNMTGRHGSTLRAPYLIVDVVREAEAHLRHTLSQYRAPPSTRVGRYSSAMHTISTQPDMLCKRYSFETSQLNATGLGVAGA